MKSLKEVLKEYILKMDKDDALKMLAQIIDETEDSEEWEILQDYIISNEDR